MKKNAETPLIDSKETRLEVNAEKTKYVSMSRELTTGKNDCIKLGNNPNKKKAVYMKKFKNKMNSWECLLLHGPESFVIPFYFQACKY